MAGLTDDPMERLARLFSRLPGIGEKSGARLAHFIFRASDRYVRELSQALVAVKDHIHPCSVCGRPAALDPCSICSDPDRDALTVMVVEEAQDLVAIERTGAYKGGYHVLGGTISALSGRGPDELNIPRLISRLKAGTVKEVIIATNPSQEGDATAAYLEEEITRELPEISISRPARGIPVGSDIKYLDSLSLEQALKGRRR